jgi:hypothetical protein
MIGTRSFDAGADTCLCRMMIHDFDICACSTYLSSISNIALDELKCGLSTLSYIVEVSSDFIFQPDVVKWVSVVKDTYIVSSVQLCCSDMPANESQPTCH